MTKLFVFTAYHSLVRTALFHHLNWLHERFVQSQSKLYLLKIENHDMVPSCCWQYFSFQVDGVVEPNFFETKRDYKRPQITKELTQEINCILRNLCPQIGVFRFFVLFLFLFLFLFFFFRHICQVFGLRVKIKWLTTPFTGRYRRSGMYKNVVFGQKTILLTLYQ